MMQDKEIEKQKNETPNSILPWVVLMQGPKNAFSRNGVATSGSKFATEDEAEKTAIMLNDFGFKEAIAAFRPYAVDLLKEPALN